MSHQGNVGMGNPIFASSTSAVAWNVSVPPRGPGFLFPSSGEEYNEILLVPTSQDDPLKKVADLASLSDRFPYHIRFPLLLTLSTHRLISLGFSIKEGTDGRNEYGPSSSWIRVKRPPLATYNSGRNAACFYCLHPTTDS